MPGARLYAMERVTTIFGLSPISGNNFAVDGKTLSRHTANGILRSAGLPKAF